MLVRLLRCTGPQIGRVLYRSRPLVLCAGTRQVHTSSTKWLSAQKGAQSAHSEEQDKIDEGYLLRVSVESLIDNLAKQPTPAVTLDDLLKFHSDLQDKDDKEAVLLDNANDTLRDLFVLVGRSTKRFMDIPFIALMNPHMATAYKCYTDTLKVLLEFVDSCKGGDSTISPYADFGYLTKFKLTTIEQNKKWISVLQQILDIHTDNLEDLRDGFAEIQPGESVDEKTFLDHHMKERILLRLLVNHHILLTQQLSEQSSSMRSLEHIGVIRMNLNVLEVLSRSFDFVNDMSSMKYADKIALTTTAVVIKTDGTAEIQEIEDLDEYTKYKPVVFPYIPDHIEYVLNEILKNSTRASMENHVKRPVEALVMLREPKSPEDCYRLDIRVTDHAGGIKPDVVSHLFDYSFTTFDEPEDDLKTLDTTGANLIAGMGYGLPMSLTYNRMFDGDIQLKTIYGEGTTVYLKWRGIDANDETMS